MVIRLFGILGDLRAPVEETIIFSSNLTPGKGVASDPVAIMMFLAVIFSYPPLLSFT